MLVFDGKSRLAKENILGIVTDNSDNPKTGRMLQLWILLKDRHPVHAINEGTDQAICGNCPHRKNVTRTCYVNPMGPTAVYNAYQRGNYTSRLVSGLHMRLGAYGDPCALPLALIKKLVKGLKSWTGYTHQWRKNKAYQKYVMASVDSETEYYEANTAGWRTFRVKRESDPLLEGEILCPNTTKGIQCIKCGLCCGTKINAKNIAINVHGKGKKHF